MNMKKFDWLISSYIIMELYTPKKSDKPGKVGMVLVKKNGKTSKIYFGDSNYRQNYSKAARKSYLARSAGIKNKQGKLTKNDKNSANYWARKVLWNA
tara:strand:- start:478 stop:768 length:291 start_codon:yes stop_codon:yes gene_type:complete